MDAIVATHPIVDYGKSNRDIKAAGRTVHPDDTIVEMSDEQAAAFTVIAGRLQCRDKREAVTMVADSVRKKKRCRNRFEEEV